MPRAAWASWRSRRAVGEASEEASAMIAFGMVLRGVIESFPLRDSCVPAAAGAEQATPGSRRVENDFCSVVGFGSLIAVSE